MQDPAVAAKPAAEAAEVTTDPLSLAFSAEASLPVQIVLFVLLAASLGVWVIWVLKALQLSRLRRAQHAFEREAEEAGDANELLNLSLKHRHSPGGRVVMELGKRHQKGTSTTDVLAAVAKRAVVSEQQKASSLMPLLSSIASAAPFIGLFGTVWGIMEAFRRIGMEKSASLPVVAPAIGEALVATAVGLLAAIPATIAYNFIDRRLGDLLEELETSAEAWVVILSSSAAGLAQAVRGENTAGLPPNVKR